jgi:hypothetical protein
MILDLDCPSCGTDEQVVLVANLPDGRKALGCASCGQEWIRGTAKTATPALPTLSELKARFPQPGDVDPGRIAYAQELKQSFLSSAPEPDPEVIQYWNRYQHIFSAAGLPTAAPKDLKDFANANIGANPGNMSVFNDAWNETGPEISAAQVREVVDYLLRGPESIALEDRLTALINGTKPYSIKGFKEALLTKVLCVVYPDRYLTILKYTGEAGKREIARAVWGLELPDPQYVSWTVGRLVIWSNDLLLTLIGDGFQTQQHAAEFLWWAKDQPAPRGAR